MARIDIVMLHQAGERRAGAMEMDLLDPLGSTGSQSIRRWI